MSSQNVYPNSQSNNCSLTFFLPDNEHLTKDNNNNRTAAITFTEPAVFIKNSIVSNFDVISAEPSSTKHSMNKIWLKTKNLTYTNLIWILLIFFFVLMSVIIVLITVATSEAPKMCLTPQCIKASSKSLKSLNGDVDPCDDFYSFACGRFLKEQIPLDENHFQISKRTLSDIVTKQLFKIIENPSLNKYNKRLSFEKIMHHCMDVGDSSEIDVQNLKSILNSLGDWPMLVGSNWKESKFDLLELMLRLRKLGIPSDFLFGIGVEINVFQSNSYIISVQTKTPTFVKDEGYRILQNFILLFFDGELSIVRPDIQACLFFINYLREFVKKEIGDIATITQFSNLTEVNWLPFFQRLFDMQNITITSKEKIYFSKRYFPFFLKKIMNAPKKIIANIYFLSIMNWMRSYLPSLRFFHEFYVPKYNKCVTDTSKSLPMLISSLYVKKYFKTEKKIQIEKLVSNVRKAYSKALQTADWLDEETKQLSLEKLNTMKICYPDELLDDKKLENYYEKLNINYTSYLSIAMSIQIFQFNNELNRLREPVKNCYSIDSSHDVTAIDAHYTPVNNRITLPAAFFQDVFYDNDRPNYLNYAAAGMIIGREMTHGFVNEGDTFDKDGNYKEWWTKETKYQFKKKSDCIVDQYKNYVISGINKNVNALLTLEENIADNNGLMQSFVAYSEWVNKNDFEETLPGLNYTSYQMFWIAFAQLWCAHESVAYQHKLLYDTHAPSRFRVIGTLSNIEGFADDFNCPVGSPVNPKTKCKIW